MLQSMPKLFTAVTVCFFLAGAAGVVHAGQESPGPWPEGRDAVILHSAAQHLTQFDGVGGSPGTPGDFEEGTFDDEWDDEWDEEEFQPGPTIADPIEPFNRVMFTFNDRLYFWVLKPVARGYEFVVPAKLRRGVSNFFNNIQYPIRFVNNVFQGKFMNAVLESERFFINTAFGGLGLADLSDRHPELKIPEEDTGQTLGVYGLGNGFYIVWPVLGPSTLRDSFGKVGDYFLYPLTYVEPWEVTTAAGVGERVNEVSFRIGDYESIKEASLDPYEAVKDGYIQFRTNQVEK